MQRLLAFIYAVILLMVSQSVVFAQSFQYVQIKDYNTDNTANVTAGNALQVDITSSSGTANMNLSQVGGSSTPTGNGISGVGGVQRVTLASDGTGHVIFWDGTNTASVSAAGAVKVDGSAVTQPVSISGSVPVTGTFWQATQPVSGTFFQATQPVSIAATVSVDGSGHTIPVSQSGTWNIGSLTSITNPVAVTGTFWQATQPVSGTFFQATQPVSAASLPLPTGAATSAKQPALGTAGSASADVISVQGIASMTALKVDGSSVTQPVSGTVTANQGGTWTVQPGNTANTTAWKVDGSAVTQPISAVSLPTHAVTQSGTWTVQPGNTANTTAWKVDGSAVTQPISGAVSQTGTWTVQPGNTANTTAWKVDGSAVTQPVSETSLDLAQGSTTSGQKGNLVQGAVTTAAPSYTTAQTSPLSLDTAGNLRVNVVTGGSGGGAVTQSGTWANQLLDSGGTNKASVSAGGALKVDGSAVTQPVSEANLDLAQASTTLGQKGNLVLAGCAGNNSGAGYVAGNTNSVLTNQDGRLLVNVNEWGSSGLAALTVGVFDGNTSSVFAPRVNLAGATCGDIVNMQSAATATGNGTTLAIQTDSGSAVYFDVHGTFVGTVTFEYANADGTFAPLICTPTIGGSPVTSTTAPGYFVGCIIAPSHVVRARISAYTSGSITVFGRLYGGIVLPAVQASNTYQINGNTVSTGNGAAGTGVQRVTLASDSTGQVTLAAGSNTIGSLTANQSVNTAQINGVTTATGNGISGTGVQRVTIASDSTGQIALAANQSVNIAQMNGVTTTTGNGTSGTGVQRVTIASDSTGQIALAAGSNTIGSLTANQSVNITQFGGATLSASNPLPDQLSQGGAVLSQANGLPVKIVSQDRAAYISVVDGAQAPVNGIWGVLVGSGTKTVKVLRVWAMSQQTTAGSVEMELIKTSSAPTFGTSTSNTATPLNSGSAAATAVCSTYTAIPTPGVKVGSIMDTFVSSPAPATAGAVEAVTVLFQSSPEVSPIVLNSASQCLEIFQATVVPTGQKGSFGFMWTEE